MIDIEYKEKLEEKDYDFIDKQFNKFSEENDIHCDFKTFSFIAKENNKVCGMITGHSYYNEVYIEDLIVLKEYRNKNIGSALIRKVEEHFKDRKFENINLTTYEFQAPKFYEKMRI